MLTACDCPSAAQVMAEKCVALNQNAGVTRQLARTTQVRLEELRGQVDDFRRQCPGRDRPLCDTLDTKGIEVAISLDRVRTRFKSYTFTYFALGIVKKISQDHTLYTWAHGLGVEYSI